MGPGYISWSSPVSPLCGFLLWWLVVALLLPVPAGSIDLKTSLEDVAQTADLIFVGTVDEIACLPGSDMSMIATEVTFRDIEVIHAREESVQREASIVKLVFAGGRTEDRSVRFSGSPEFDEGRRYLLFTLDDGKLYINPLVGGSQGLFEIIPDLELEAEYLSNGRGRLVASVGPEGFGFLAGSVTSVKNGLPVHAAPKKEFFDGVGQERLPEPASTRDSVAAGGLALREGADQPLPLYEFIQYIKDQALHRTGFERRLRRGGQGGSFVFEKDGRAENIPLESSRPGHSIFEGTNVGDWSLEKGQDLFTCGYQNLNIVMEQVPEGWREWQVNNDSMWLWNQFMDLYRVTADDGSWGNNGESEFAGYPSDADLFDAWGFHWDSNPAMTVTEFGSTDCGRIYETDVLLNPAYSWTDDEFLAIGNGSVLLLSSAIMHEVGHTWGYMNGTVGEQYNYDSPSVMHAYYSDLVENGYGIHAPDAYLVRRQYDNQTGVPSILDIGVESYYASNGLHNSTTNATEYYPNDQVTVSNLTVENNSTSSVSDLRLRLYLSTNRIISTGDYQVGSYWYWPSFAKEHFSLSSPSTWVPTNVPPGDYYVGAIVTTNGYSWDDYTANNATSLFETVRIYPGSSTPWASDGDYDYRIRLAWQPVLGATSYDVFRRDCFTCTSALLVNTTSTTIDDRSSIDPECTYYYTTRAKSPFGDGRISPMEGGSNRFAVPDGVTASSGLTDRVQVGWDGVSGAISYALWRSETPMEEGTRIATVITGTSYNDYGAAEGVPVFYRVAAQNTCGAGPSSLPVEGVRRDPDAIFRDGFESAFFDRWTNVVPPFWYWDCDHDGFAPNGFVRVQVDVPTSPPGGCIGGTWTPLAPSSPSTRDCNDGASSAYPGQSDYFPGGYQPSGAPGGSNFDYNCDGFDDERFTTLSPTGPLADCVVSGGLCRRAGWPGWDGDSVPVCGQEADYLDCGWVFLGHYAVCGQTRTLKTQSCK